MLRVGEQAPFDGILETPTQQALLQVRGEEERIQKRIELEVRTATKTAANDLAYERELRQIDRGVCKEKLEAHDKVLEEARPGLFERPVVLIPLTVAGTLVVVGGVTAIACALAGCG